MTEFPEVALCRRVGVELRDAAQGALAAAGLAALGTKDMADGLGTTQVFTSRLRKLLRAEHGEEAVLVSPGIGPMRKLVTLLAQKGTAPEPIERLRLAVQEFDRLLRLVVGDRRTLEALLFAFMPGGAEAYEAPRRQAAFRAFGEGMGLSAELFVDTTLVLPGTKPGSASLAMLETIHGLERYWEDSSFQLNAELTPLLGEVPQPRSDRAQALAGLELSSFLEAPPAPLEPATSASGEPVMALGPTGIGPGARVDLAFVDLLEDAVPAGEPAVGDPRRFALTTGLACRRLVTEVMVHRDLFAGRAPEPLLATTVGVGQVDLLNPVISGLLLPFYGSYETLKPGPRGWELPEAPLRGRLTTRAVELLGHAPEEFHGYRLSVALPFPWGRFFHCWFHPEDPLRGLLSTAQRGS